MPGIESVMVPSRSIRTTSGWLTRASSQGAIPPYDSGVALVDHQPEALADLDAVLDRAHAVVDPRLWSLATQRIEHTVADGPEPDAPVNESEAAVCAVVEQMLIDVAALDDATVRRAADALGGGALADLVMASYVYEASTRLRVAGSRLLGAGT